MKATEKIIADNADTCGCLHQTTVPGQGKKNLEELHPSLPSFVLPLTAEVGEQHLGVEQQG